MGAFESDKHKEYVRALETVRVQPVFGEFKRKDKRCLNCRTFYQTYEEKQTDVNIAIKLFVRKSTISKSTEKYYF